MRYLAALLLVIAGLVTAPPGAAGPSPSPTPVEPAAVPVVYLAVVDDAITPVTATYIEEAIAAAELARAAALVVQLDTPGGLVSSMREIVKDILASKVPVMVYVGPPGAHAGSAGAFITIAAHVAAMAPGTNIGAASPVAAGGGEIDETMQKKIVNDAAAYIEGLARQRGRNAEWAVKAVREAASVQAEEAAKLNVVDFVAVDVAEALDKADGRTVDVLGRKQVIRTKGARIEPFEMRWNLRVLAVLANPNLAYLLFLAGLAGLAIEFYNPGAILPGVTGAIALILAMFAFQVLPINWAGILLILVGLGLLIAEVTVASHGILGVGGVVALALGSIIFVDWSAPNYLRVSLLVVVPTVATLALGLLFVIGAAVRSQRRPAMGGEADLIGETGEALGPIAPEGKVFVHGEYWNARSATPIAAGERVRVTAVRGFVLEVEPADRTS
ncbi:MAG TPA: nodulation protein NfeD [Thermodesulfobacteriota bacterium]